MKGFIDFLGCIYGLAILALIIILIVAAVQIIIVALPVIIGFTGLLFIIYVFIVGLCHLGDNSKKK